MALRHNLRTPNVHSLGHSLNAIVVLRKNGMKSRTNFKGSLWF